VSRTFHFGTKGGTSNNQFGGNLNKIHLNQEFMDWKFFNLLSLMEGVYDRNYFSMISSADPALSLELALESSKSKHVRLEYSSILEFAKLARSLKIMDDEKAGIPRTSYRGVVEIRPYGENILFLVPPFKALKDAFHC
jgi:alpha-1,3-mannosyl-glycoprotein beta-1,2-N-acetylglucosaminyltransferase